MPEVRPSTQLLYNLDSSGPKRVDFVTELDARLAMLPEVTHVPGMGELTARQVVAAELIHDGNPDDVVATRSQLSHEEIGALRENIDSYITRLLDTIEGSIRADEVLSEEDIMLAGGYVMAAYAHEEQVRDSGKQYISHPHEAMMISRHPMVERRLRAQGYDDDALLRLEFETIMHDAYLEDVQPDNGSGTPLAPKGKDGVARLCVSSPLIIERWFERCGRDDSAETIVALNALTKSRTIYGEKMSPAVYEQQLRASRDAAIVKQFDIVHNDKMTPRSVRAWYEKYRKENNTKVDPWEAAITKYVTLAEEYETLRASLAQEVGALALRVVSSDWLDEAAKNNSLPDTQMFAEQLAKSLEAPLPVPASRAA